MVLFIVLQKMEKLIYNICSAADKETPTKIPTQM
jgi:hypothetical protein